MENPWKTKRSEVAYSNPWISVEHNEVVNPAGGDGIYGVVRFKNVAVGVVPIDDEGYTYLVGQYRYATDRYEWEIPEGGCPIGTDPLATAKRELKEETGLTAQWWSPLGDFYLSNSVTDEYGIAYLARDLQRGASEPEDTEELQIKRLPIRDAIDMVLSGDIKDAVSVIALQRVALQLGSDLPTSARAGGTGPPAVDEYL